MPETGRNEAEQRAIREHLERILKSEPFHQSRRRQRFLEYIVTETLEGRGERLKGYAIALAVFDRPASFDPGSDPIVRIEAGRLRDRLREFYQGEGRHEAVRIELPKGSYTPTIEVRQQAMPAPKPASAEAAQPDLPSAPASLEAEPPAAAEEATGAGGRHEPRDRGLRQVLDHAHRQRTGLMVAALVLVVAAGLWAMRGRERDPASYGMPAIAVLPFDNLGDDPTWQRFADGITEDIITDLAHARNLLVIARNSTAVYKDKPVDIRQVGRDLNVKYVLEGSIQALDGRVRVTAQLIEAASGGHVWSERYDRPVENLFQVKTEVSERIAATLIGYQGAVAEAERNLLRRKAPASLSAYDTYLLGVEAKHKVTRDGLTEAERLFRKAIEIDPQLARAYCGLATVQYYLIDLGLAPSVEEAVSRMSEAAEQAVRLDPNDGLSHQVLGMAYAYQGKPEQSLAEFNRAEALAPSDADLLLVIAWSLPAFGETARAVSLAERALQLNPRYPDWYNQGLSVVYLFGEKYELALKHRLLVKQPVAVDHAFIAVALAQLGRTREAASATASVLALDPAWNAERYLSEAGGYADKEAELFVEGAQKAGLAGCVAPDRLQQMPTLIRVRACDQLRAKTAG